MNRLRSVWSENAENTFAGEIRLTAYRTTSYFVGFIVFLCLDRIATSNTSATLRFAQVWCAIAFLSTIVVIAILLPHVGGEMEPRAAIVLYPLSCMLEIGASSTIIFSIAPTFIVSGLEDAPEPDRYDAFVPAATILILLIVAKYQKRVTGLRFENVSPIANSIFFVFYFGVASLFVLIESGAVIPKPKRWEGPQRTFVMWCLAALHSFFLSVLFGLFVIVRAILEETPRVFPSPTPGGMRRRRRSLFGSGRRRSNRPSVPDDTAEEEEEEEEEEGDRDEPPPEQDRDEPPPAVVVVQP